MMMNRERIGFWVRLLSIVLAVFFVGSFIFVVLGTNLSYNLFDLIGGSNQQQGGQTTDSQAQIAQAQKQLKENPKDPEAVKNLAALYYQDGRLEDAARVLERGHEAAPKDQEIPILLGQAYDQAGEPAQAIKYYNGYLDREPNSQQASAVKERISALLKGGITTENT